MDECEAMFGQGVHAPQITLVEGTYLPAWAFHFDKADVAIGTHSWSELPWDLFLSYFNAIVPRVKYILYATQPDFPSTAIVNKKLELFKRHYDVVVEKKTENGRSHNYVFKLRESP